MDRIENYANRGREITCLYFTTSKEAGEYSKTITETTNQEILVEPIGSINRDMDKFHLS